MTKRSKIIISSLVILVVLIVGGFFIFSRINNNSSNKEVPKYTPEGEIAQTDDNPEIVEDSSNNNGSGQTVNNSDVSKDLKPSEDMQKVISDNKNDLNNSEVMSEITESYPRDLIPLYKAKSAADSSDIVTQNGNPGWIAQYGSDATVPEIADFYKSLLGSTSGYSADTNGDTNTIKGTIDNCTVSVTVTPNNPERTGLNDQANVDIFIERN